METKFTKGPLRADFAGGYGRVGIFSEELLGTARQVGSGDDRIDIAEANASLWAAAPDLYEALDTAARRFRQYESLHRAKLTTEGNLKADNNADLAAMCEAALAKARGEPL